MTALTDRARTWSERLSFHPFASGAPDRLELYLLTSEIDATLRQIRYAPVTGIRALRDHPRELQDARAIAEAGVP